MELNQRLVSSHPAAGPSRQQEPTHDNLLDKDLVHHVAIPKCVEFTHLQVVLWAQARRGWKQSTNRTCGGKERVIPVLGTQTFQGLEGCRVSIALNNGDRLDDCELVSGPRGEAQCVWLFTTGMDVFVPLADVLAVWETGRG